jgi:putative polyhydroxyalkanoate system protein
MPHIDVSRPHALGADGARQATDAVAAKLSREFGLSTTWQGDRLHFDGSGLTRGVTGHLQAGADTIRVALDLPFKLRPLRRKIEQEIQSGLDEALG